MTTPTTRRVLITVKAYPNPSKTYVETVCSAGIEVDTSQWIRLYPVPFRDLDHPKKFKKYDIIEVKCWKAPDDHRVESYKIDMDSIKFVSHLDTKRNWESRKNIVLPTVSPPFVVFCMMLKMINLWESSSLVTLSYLGKRLHWKVKLNARHVTLSFVYLIIRRKLSSRYPSISITISSAMENQTAQATSSQ